MQPSSSITQSQRVYIIEVLFILLPFTLMIAYFTIILGIELLMGTPFKLFKILDTWPLFVIAAFSSAWYLSYIFIKTGTAGLKKVHFAPIFICWLGALVVIASSTAIIFGKYPSSLTFVVGIPLLLPFAHIAYERHFNKVSNQPFKRDYLR